MDEDQPLPLTIPDKRFKVYKPILLKPDCISLDDIFDKATAKEIAQVNEFVRNLINAGISFTSIGIIQEDKTCSDTYHSSEIDFFGKKFTSHSVPYSYDGSGNFIGRRFNLLFGSGVLEYERRTEEFDFSFRYNTSDSIKQEILERLKLKNVKPGVTRGTSYSVRVYPANPAAVKKAYEQIQRVDRALKLAPRISRHIDSLIDKI